ncbi:MAG: M20/M25/M40 family metallo-hydrolase [Bacillota bacterium]|nr:M20/M25/M40 family metallo-hydrolase [Bacillota bacterium]
MSNSSNSLFDRALHYLEELVAMPSPSGDEANVSRYLATVLEGFGLSTELQPVGPRYNVISRTPATQETAALLLTGHTDTIPVMTGWRTDPFRATSEGERIYGLGAADQKGGIAAQLAALEALRAEGRLEQANVLVAFTPDEEALSDGMLAFLAGKPRARLVLLSEPHFHPATIGWPGKALVKATVHGKAAHGGRPSQGVNAIEQAAHFLSALSAAAVPEHPNLGAHPFVSLSIKGGYERYSLTVPDRCTVVISKQLVPGETKDTVLELVRKATATLTQGHVDFEFDRPYYPPAEQDAGNPAIQRFAALFREVTGQPLSLGFGRGVCDGDYLVEAGLTTVSFGPSGGNTHQPNEWVSKVELATCAEVYLAALKSWCVI